MDIFWAKCDDDLIAKMINDVKRGLKGSHILSKLSYTIQYRWLKKNVEIF